MPRALILRTRLLRMGMVLPLLAMVVPVMAQNAVPPKQDPLGPGTERGIRLTPEMARAISSAFVRNALMRHYEMDESKADEAAELVARRLMAAAHENGAAAQALMEWGMTQALELEAKRREGSAQGNSEFASPEFCQQLGERVLPLIPGVRGLIRGVGQDIRPLLPIKQQLKLGAELTMVGGSMDVFEQNMQRWARGEALPGENPFSKNNATEKDANGQTAALQNARKAADQELNKEKSVLSVWDTYLKAFKKFYALDDGQCATADSIYREFAGRLKTTLSDSKWQDNMYQARMWIDMTQALRIPWRHPIRQMLQEQYESCMDPINALGDAFRLRLEQIPTGNQRAAADARMMTALQDKGFKMPTTEEAK